VVRASRQFSQVSKHDRRGIGAKSCMVSLKPREIVPPHRRLAGLLLFPAICTLGSLPRSSGVRR